MLPYFSGTFGNPSSPHAFGRAARKAIEDARETVAICIGASPQEICFTSGGTESDNLALTGAARACAKRGRHVITSQVEHHAVLNCLRRLTREGFEVTALPVDRFGLLEARAVEAAILPGTVLISVMLANNETGTLEPVGDIARAARARGVPVHTDAVQAVGKVAVRVDDLGVDLLSISSHKMHGPKGVGALYVRRGTRVEPIIHGGHHEGAKRAGTENVAGIVGFARAIELAVEELSDTSGRLASLRDRLERAIFGRIERVRLNGHPQRRLPNILNAAFEAVDGEALLAALDRLGIAVSTGSACTSGRLEPSHVLRAMRVPPGLARGSVRFSVGRGNTDEEMDFAARELGRVVRRLRRTTPMRTGRALHPAM
jgi:cysteine desulfurase